MKPETSVAILIYSKYSKKSKSFLEQVQSFMNLNPTITLHMLCIDNETIRKAVLEDVYGYRIQFVPCVILFYSDGTMEKKEGLDAFTWIRSVSEQQSISSISHHNSPSTSTSVSLPTSSSSLSSSVSSPVTSQVSTSASSSTSLPIPQSLDSSELNTSRVKQEDISTPQITRKKENILSLAATMAKQREVEDEKLNPNPYAKAKEAQEKIQDEAVRTK